MPPAPPIPESHPVRGLQFSRKWISSNKCIFFGNFSRKTSSERKMQEFRFHIASVEQKLLSFDYPKLKIQIQSEANHCIKVFSIPKWSKSLHTWNCNVFASVAQNCFSFDYSKSIFQIQSEANSEKESEKISQNDSQQDSQTDSQKDARNDSQQDSWLSKTVLESHEKGFATGFTTGFAKGFAKGFATTLTLCTCNIPYTHQVTF